MRAIVWTKYGPPEGLKLKEIQTPIPKPDEVLIKIHATSVFTGDCEMRALQFPFYFRIPLRIFFGLRKPRRDIILGQELSGEIEAIGDHVTLFKPGDPVFAAMGIDMGAYAEYKCMPEKPQDAVIGKKPVNLTFQEATTLPVGGLNALYFLRKTQISAGQKVLIIGGGGSIGTVLIQLVKSKGAEVTVVDHNAKLEKLQAIGADHTIDYTKEKFVDRGIRYDSVFDVAGKSVFSNVLRSVAKNGTLILVNPKLSHIIRGKFHSWLTSKSVKIGTVNYRKQDLDKLIVLVEDGTIKPVVDRTYPLEQIVEAHMYVDSGQKTGNVVITVR